MDTERICPSCQKPLAPDVPLGLCPECLIKSGFPTGVESAGAKQPPFIPPTVEELAKLFPQLEILGLIGKGGMGAVYKARQPKLNRFVALKILPPSIGGDPTFAERFAREAQALAQLNHPGIVILYEFGQAGGLHFFMMEYVDGVNLRQLLINGRIAPREALAIVPQICDALQFAHDQGIVHRDIKPENILLDRRGHVKIADFGLAKIVGGADEPVSGASAHGAPLLTETGKIIGTPQYMSPEQIANPADVDNRADIYALGVVFYQMLTGELPGKKIEPPSKKVHIDVRLDEVVLRALESNPELRFQQVSEVKTCVDTIVGTSGHEAAQTESERGQPGQSPSTPASTNRAPRFSLIAILGGVCVPLSFAPLFHFTIVLMVFLMRFSERDTPFTPHRWVNIVGAIMFLTTLILIAPMVTTILGWIAVSQIRRSAGKLHGMRLAVFDGLVFPLLAVDAVIFGLAYLIELLVAKLPYFAPSGDGGFGGGISMGYQIALYSLLGLGGASLISIIADFFIIRRVWRAVNKMDSANSIALSAVKSWLAIMDGGNYAQSWEEAAKYFQRAITKAEWIERSDSARKPAGKVVSRQLRTARRFGSRFTVKFDTAFAGLKATVETVMFSRESDGQWRAIGYRILPAYAEQSRLRRLGIQALFFAGLSGVLGTLAFCFMPKTAPVLDCSILAAALVGIVLGISSRRNRLGKSAIVVGSINVAIWLFVLAAWNLQSNMRDISPQTSPFRDTAKYLSPFTMVHFDTNDINKVLVAYNGSEYELAAIDDLPVADVLDFCRHQYGQSALGERWAQKRFAEDLVVVLSDMKHPVSSDNTVSLTLVDPPTGRQKIIAHAPMTEKNRAAIVQDRTLENSKLLHWDTYQSTPFYIGKTYFPKGDSIVITSVSRTKEQMVVKGHYNLVSTDRARLGLHITTSSTNSTPTDPRQWMQISKGQGDFELTHPHVVPGSPHLAMYPMGGGESFADIYFGTQAEPAEESRLGLGN